MKANFSTIVRGASLLAGVSLALTAVTARGSDKANSDAFPNFDSYIKITGQAPSISGDENAYQRRMQASRSGGVGIEDFHFAKDLNKATSMEVNGHALAGSEDYLASVKIVKNEFGSVDFGYKTFRTFYDGVGGFFPLNGNWMPLNDRNLYLDRGKFWAEATLALPNAPVFTIKYTRDNRDGKKDTTIWGDTDFTGMPNNNPPISQVRKMNPSYIDMNEKSEALEFTAKHTIGNTSLQLTLLGEHIDNLDTRYLTRFVGEARPFPTPASTLLVPAAQMNNQVVITQGDGIDSKMTSAMFNTDTKFSDTVSLKVGLNYQLLHADQSGSRFLVTSTPTATGVVPITTANYNNLVGGSRIKTLTGTVALDVQATKDLSFKFGIKSEEEYIRSDAAFDVIAASGTPAVTLATTQRKEWAHMSEKLNTPEVEVRYTGIKDLALYANMSRAKATGTEKNTSAYNPATATSGTNALMNGNESHANYTIGANWKPVSLLVVRAELFKKSHQNESVGFGVQAGDYYMLDNNFTGVKGTVIVKPTDVVSVTGRYVYQKGTMEVTGYLPTFPAFPACDATNHTLAGTIDFTPNNQFYAQANVNVVFNTISTIYPRAGITPATSTNIAYDTNRVLHNANNNYVTASFLCGTTVSKNDDLQFQVTYYKADNDDSALAGMTMPYGAVAKDTSATVGLKHKFSERLVGDAKVGYFDSTNDTNGGKTNFHGPQGYLSLTYAL